MITAQEFIDELSRRLRDVKKKQWDDGFLVSALNSALGALTTVMPTAYTVNRDIALVDGVEQEIDGDLHRIISMLHNVSSVDGTPRRAVTKADMSVFDASHPHWRQDDVRTYIRHWFIDEFDESKFYVWPPAAGAKGDEPVVPTDPGPVAPGVTQEDVDAYNAAVAAHAAWEASPLPHILRGTFSATPFISDSDSVATESPGDPPVAPVDPGPIADGIPDYVNRYEPVVAQLTQFGFGNSTTRTYEMSPTLPKAVGEMWIMDFSNASALLADVDEDVYISIRPDPSVFSYSKVFGNSPFTDAVYAGDPSQVGLWPTAGGLTVKAIRYLVEQGTPYLAVYGVNQYLYAAASEPFATIDDAPIYLANASVADTIVADPSNSSLSTQTVAIASGDTVIARAPRNAATAAAMYPVMVAVQPGDFVHLRPLNSGGQRYLVIQSGGNELVYYLEISPFEAWSETATDFAIGAASQGQFNQQFFVARQSTPEQEGLLIMTSPRLDDTGRLSFGWPTSDVIAAYEQRVTQDTVDAYVEALEQHVIERRAYDVQLAAYTAFLRGEILSVESALPVKRAHLPALQEFAMYYAYSVDDDLTANSGRANRHWLAFFQMLNKREDANLLIETAREVTE